MSQNILVLDLETQRTFEDIGSRNNLKALGVSVVGVYSYKTEKYHAFWEKDFPKLESWLQERPFVVGFNQRKFDMPVLQAYMKLDLSKLPMVDLLEDIHKVLGHRVSLDSVAQATLGKSKIGHGLDAIKYWRTGDLEKLREYCLEDVRITKEVFEYGIKQKEVFYLSKFGNNKLKASIDWKMKHPEARKEDEKQISLF